jgi:hypothetical protein
VCFGIGVKEERRKTKRFLNNNNNNNNTNGHNQKTTTHVVDEDVEPAGDQPLHGPQEAVHGRAVGGGVVANVERRDVAGILLFWVFF